MTASQWFARYGWLAFLSLLVPGLTAAFWLHFVWREKGLGRSAWAWPLLAAAAAFGIVVSLMEWNGATLFASGAGFSDVVAGLYLSGVIATAAVILLTVLFALSPLLDFVLWILRIFD